jgi:hypothetical protein
VSVGSDAGTDLCPLYIQCLIPIRSGRESHYCSKSLYVRRVTTNSIKSKSDLFTYAHIGSMMLQLVILHIFTGKQVPACLFVQTHDWQRFRLLYAMFQQ